ncbi:MAG: Fic family protein, partial [Polyangiaceae bacterium]
KKKSPTPAPAEPPPRPMSIEDRTASLEARLQQADPQFQAQYRDNLDMSWISHDSALEGVVYTMQELQTAIDPNATFVGDSSLQPICEEIRRHREALGFVREYAAKRKQPITLDVVKRIYTILHPEEGDIKTVKYRKDIPQHRLYFHEYAAPDKITYKVRQIVDWINDPETRRTRSAMRLAARAHYDLLRVFPFAHDSGKVARLLMNLLLLRSGLPPAIVHSTERQRYYEALKGSSATMAVIVQEAIENNLASIEKMLDARDANREEEQRAGASRGDD